MKANKTIAIALAAMTITHHAPKEPDPTPTPPAPSAPLPDTPRPNVVCFRYIVRNAA